MYQVITLNQIQIVPPEMLQIPFKASNLHTPFPKEDTNLTVGYDTVKKKKKEKYFPDDR